MRKVGMLVLSVVFIGILSCKDTQKEEEALEAAIEKIETVEEEVSETIKEVEEKATEVDAALSELDSL